MLLVRKTHADETGQHTAGTNLDEGASARLPHRLNLFEEPHWLSNLVGECGPHFLRVTGVRLRRRVGIDGHLRCAKGNAGEERGEGAAAELTIDE